MSRWIWIGLAAAGIASQVAFALERWTPGSQLKGSTPPGGSPPASPPPSGSPPTSGSKAPASSAATTVKTPPLRLFGAAYGVPPPGPAGKVVTARLKLIGTETLSATSTVTTPPLRLWGSQ